jgi:hypothetical protein
VTRRRMDLAGCAIGAWALFAVSACSQPAAQEPHSAPPSAAPPLAAPAAAAQPPAAQSALPAAPSEPRAPLAASGPLRFIALGGGPTPESNEVSLEQDIALVQRALPGPGLVLFAGGSASPSVRELDPNAKGDPVRTALGALFAPRSGRQSRYRAPSFSAERATLENVDARLTAALSEGDSPLLVYIAAHGDQGSEAKDNSVALWGGGALSVAALAELHEGQRRPLRLIATSCFSGGFGELAFAGADAGTPRPSPVPRCGLFAGTSDRETSGCDPNPNRRAQESYGLHLVHALAGTRRNGTPLGPADSDFDHDGKIGLLDAHTWARIEAVSFDVPTTTSERWLRQVEPGSAPIDRALSPEDAAVIERLGAALGLSGERAVEQRWGALYRQIGALESGIDRAEAELADRVASEATLLLERWPVLDDPFHPDFEATFRDNRAAIEQLLTSSPEAHERARADQRAHALYDELEAVAVQEARVLRVSRAYETLHKAAALRKRGGPAAKYYAKLLACERAAP